MIDALLSAADDDPLSRQAFPDFRQIPAASAVTLGRPS